MQCLSRVAWDGCGPAVRPLHNARIATSGRSGRDLMLVVPPSLQSGTLDLSLVLPAEAEAKSTPRTAADLYRAACAGDMDAATVLGFKYWRGCGVKLDQNIACGLLTEAARHGKVDAMTGLANIHRWRGDVRAMLNCFGMAFEERTCPYACFYFGSYLLSEPDLDRAVLFLRVAAGEHLVPAILLLANTLRTRQLPQDVEETVQLLRLGAALDDVECMFMLAKFLIEKRPRAHIDDVEFVLVMERAAELGSVHARQTLEANKIASIPIGPLTEYYPATSLFSWPDPDSHLLYTRK